MAPPNASESGTAKPLPGLSRTRLADQIADILREQMLTGALEPGAPIHERETAAALGVSRTPLREAILILEAEGMVETAPARSPTVVNPTASELIDLLIVQSALEAVAGEQACKEADAKQIAKIRSLHETMVRTSRSGDPVFFFKTDMDFHKSIVHATGNQPLIKTHEQYNTRLWRARFMSSSRQFRRSESMQHHGDIVDAIEKRDGDRAADILRLHLLRAIGYITMNRDGDPEKPIK